METEADPQRVPRWVGAIIMAICLLAIAAATQINLTTQVQGVLPVANGGSGAATFTAHYWFGNNTGSTAAPGASGIGTQDVTPNMYVAGGGTAQAQTATMSPAATALATGLVVNWLPVAANTGSGPTLNVNSLGAKTIIKAGGASLVANDLTTTAIATVIYDGTYFELQNPQTVNTGTISSCSVTNSVAYYSASTTVSCLSEAGLSQYLYGTGGGSASAQTVTLAPALAALATGVEVAYVPSVANSAGPTLAVSGLTAKNITKCGTTALIANDLNTSVMAFLLYDGTEWQLLNPQAGPCGAMQAGTGTGNFSDDETPSGSCNSSNQTFTLAHTPAPAASLNLYYNGQRVEPGGADYSLSTATITTVFTCKSGDILRACYRY